MISMVIPHDIFKVIQINLFLKMVSNPYVTNMKSKSIFIRKRN